MASNTDLSELSFDNSRLRTENDKLRKALSALLAEFDKFSPISREANDARHYATEVLRKP